MAHNSRFLTLLCLQHFNFPNPFWWRNNHYLIGLRIGQTYRKSHSWNLKLNEPDILQQFLCYLLFYNGPLGHWLSQIKLNGNFETNVAWSRVWIKKIKSLFQFYSYKKLSIIFTKEWIKTKNLVEVPFRFLSLVILLVRHFLKDAESNISSASADVDAHNEWVWSKPFFFILAFLFAWDKASLVYFQVWVKFFKVQVEPGLHSSIHKLEFSIW